jgi:DivIVA domain-containing protein
MPLPPDEVTSAGFRRRLRGYDRRQVNALLERVRADYAAALEQIARSNDPQALYDSLGQEVASMARTLREHAEELRRAAEREVQRIRGEAEDIRASATREAEQVRRARDEADREVRELMASAVQRRDDLLAEIEADRQQFQRFQQRLRGRIGELESTLAALRTEAEGWSFEPTPALADQHLSGLAGDARDGDEPTHVTS